jgi:hypothetical protein
LDNNPFNFADAQTEWFLQGTVLVGNLQQHIFLHEIHMQFSNIKRITETGTRLSSDTALETLIQIQSQLLRKTGKHVPIQLFIPLPEHIAYKSEPKQYLSFWTYKNCQVKED